MSNVPGQMCCLTSLENLDLSFNQLRVFPHPPVERDTALSHVTHSHNNDSFGLAQSLKRLVVSGVRFFFSVAIELTCFIEQYEMVV